jgi:hypothetical protein
MSPSPTRPYTRVLQGAAGALALSLITSLVYAQAGGPFGGMGGSWSGGGTITVLNGTSERIRCRNIYKVENSGRSLIQDLRCASDSYKFEVRSNVNADGGAVFGTWTETTRNASGNVSGRISGGNIQATVIGPGFTAALAVSTHGSSQTVSIRPVGTDVTAVSISLSRR